MSFFIIFISSFIASAIAFLSGFGFLTIVMPVLAFFLPIPLAVAVTALAHLFHLIVKLGLTYKAINYPIAWRFGLIALLFSIPGAFFLKYISNIPPFYVYHIKEAIFEMSYIKITVGFILLLSVTLSQYKKNSSKANFIIS